MLQEILLSLSGYQSEVFEKVKRPVDNNHGINNFISEPERAMLDILGHIAELHVEIKQTAAQIAGTHPSSICRAVASAISDVHLAAFRKQIIAVEASILRRDSNFVGGYGIVPLSTIAGEFSPWTRRLEWLRGVTQFSLRSDTPKSTPGTSGKAMLDFLESETHTGHSDLEEIAVKLQISAQKVWMRSVAAWVLYGSLPSFGAGDFFIQQNRSHSEGVLEFLAVSSLLPNFVSKRTGETMLAIGDALKQINAQLKTSAKENLNGEVKPSSLLPKHLKILGDLQYPLNAWILQQAVHDIDMSISLNVLSSILPMEQVAGLLDVIHRYCLLSEGEFVTGLIEQAAARLASRQITQATKPVRKVGRVDDLTIKDAELGGVLAKTWDELSLLDDGVNNDTLAQARNLLVLHGGNELTTNATLLSTIMPIPVVLKIELPSGSNLRTFLHTTETDCYARISAFLLSIRRAELQLSQLWKLTSQRRCHPTPTGPPLSATPFGQQGLLIRRSREASRATGMRQHWASASKTLYVLNEFNGYLHGEVIRDSWEHFQTWFHGGNSRTFRGSRPGTASSGKPPSTSSRSREMNDPRTLAKGHRSFLEALRAGLLLDKSTVLAVLKELLNTIDHYVALFSRVSSIWQGLDLQEDEGVVDAFTNYKDDERAVLAEMSRCRIALEEQIATFVEALKTAEHGRITDAVEVPFDAMELESHAFVPWKVRTLDRLIIKLDYLAGAGGREKEDETLVDDSGDQ